MPQNSKPFHEEINLAKRLCGPHKTALRAKWAALVLIMLLCLMHVEIKCYVNAEVIFIALFLYWSARSSQFFFVLF